MPPLQLPPERDRRVARLDELPLRFDPDIQVYAPAAGSLRVRRESGFFEQLSCVPGRLDGLLERRTGLGIEIDPQLVRLVGVRAANRPRVKHDRTHLRGPCDVFRAGRAQLD